MISDEHLAQLRALLDSVLAEHGIKKLGSKAAQRQRRYREKRRAVTKRSQPITNRNASLGENITKRNGHNSVTVLGIGDGEIIAVLPSLRGEVEVRRSFLAELIEAYPAVMVGQEIDRAKLWLEANPAKRKTNLRRFLTNWIARNQG